MSIYFNTKKKRGKLFKRVLYNLGILLCKVSDVKDYFHAGWPTKPQTLYRIRYVLYGFTERELLLRY